MLSEEKTEQIKKQVIEQIESTFPEDKKQTAIGQIEAMNSEQFEKFLEQNKLMQQNQASEGQCIFCLINSGQISSYKLNENENAIAVLEINPISKAHSLIIPKNHLGNEKIAQDIHTFAKRLTKKVKTEFKPKEMILSEDNLFGHKIINLIPVYENETINSNRYKAEKEELENVQKALKKKSTARKKPIEKIVIKRPKKSETKKTRGKKTRKTKENQWLPRRIP